VEDNKGFQRWQFATLSSDAPQARQAREEAPAPMVAEEELAKIRDAARAEGYTAGFAAGRGDAADTIAAEAAHLRTLAGALDAARLALQEDTAQSLLLLATDIAQRILGCELAQNPAAMLPAVREAMDLAGNGTHPQLFLNPGDVEFVRRHLGDDLAVADWRLVEDARIEPGGCRAVSADGMVDATLAARWKRAAAALGVPAPDAAAVKTVTPALAADDAT
jgi:flagellar assembly protein FliH